MLKKAGKVRKVGRNLWVAAEIPETADTGTNPFDIPLNEFLSMDVERVRELHMEVYRRCREVIEDAFRRGMRQVVICDGKIVYETRDLIDIPPEKIRELIERHKKPCYVFVAEDFVEESPWALIGDEDYSLISNL